MAKWIIGTEYIYGKNDSDGRNIEVEFSENADENEVIQYAIDNCLIDMSEETISYIELDD